MNIKQMLATFVDAGRLAGYVRAGVAAGLGVAIAHVPVLKDFLDPATQTALGVAISGIVVGIWSHYVKGA